jgi:hypothetical protein
VVESLKFSTVRLTRFGKLVLNHEVNVDLTASEWRDEESVTPNGREISRTITEAVVTGATPSPTFSVVTTSSYAKPFEGMRNVQMTSVDGKTAVAVIDGRTSLPFEARAKLPLDIKFKDGKRVPLLTLEGEGFRKEYEQLLFEAAREAKICWEAKSAAPITIGSGKPATVALLRADAATNSLRVCMAR